MASSTSSPDAVLKAAVSIAVLGGSVGKTSLICRFIQRSFDSKDRTSTVESNYSRVFEPGDSLLPLQVFSRESIAALRQYDALCGTKVCVKVDILDTSGDLDMYESLRPSWYAKGQGVVFCFSVNDPLSFDELQIYYAEWIATYKKDFNGLPPAVLVGTHSDSAQQRKVPADKARALAEKWQMSYIETSAKSGANVDLAFQHIINRTLCTDPTVKDLIRRDSKATVKSGIRERKEASRTEQRSRRDTERIDREKQRDIKHSRKQQDIARARRLKSEPTRIFGIALGAVVSRVRNKDADMPDTIASAIEYVRDRGLCIEGIFRLSGSLKIIQKLQARADKADPIDWHAENINSHDVAGFIKLYVRELPEPLFQEDMYDQFLTTWTDHEDDDDESAFLEALSELLRQLPRLNARFLYRIMLLLRDVASHSEENKMQAHNCVIVFAPNIMYVTGEAANVRNIVDMPGVNGTVMACLSHIDRLFGWLDDEPISGVTHAAFREVAADSFHAGEDEFPSEVGQESKSDSDDSMDELMISSRVVGTTIRKGHVRLDEEFAGTVRPARSRQRRFSNSRKSEETVDTTEDVATPSERQKLFIQTMANSISKREITLKGQEELLTKLAAEARAQNPSILPGKRLCDRCDIEIAEISCNQCSKSFFCRPCHQEHHIGRWASHVTTAVGDISNAIDSTTRLWTAPVQSLSDKRRERKTLLGGSRVEDARSETEFEQEELEERERAVQAREQAIADRMAAIQARKRQRKRMKKDEPDSPAGSSGTIDTTLKDADIALREQALAEREAALRAKIAAKKSAKASDNSPTSKRSAIAAATDSMKTLKLCLSCSQPVKKGDGTALDEKIWHRQCFVCCVCKLTFKADSRFALKGKLIFHAECKLQKSQSAAELPMTKSGKKQLKQTRERTATIYESIPSDLGDPNDAGTVKAGADQVLRDSGARRSIDDLGYEIIPDSLILAHGVDISTTNADQVPNGRPPPKDTQRDSSGFESKPNSVLIALDAGTSTTDADQVPSGRPKPKGKVPVRVPPSSVPPKANPAPESKVPGVAAKVPVSPARPKAKLPLPKAKALNQFKSPAKRSVGGVQPKVQTKSSLPKRGAKQAIPKLVGSPKAKTSVNEAACRTKPLPIPARTIAAMSKAESVDTSTAAEGQTKPSSQQASKSSLAPSGTTSPLTSGKSSAPIAKASPFLQQSTPSVSPSLEGVAKATEMDGSAELPTAIGKAKFDYESRGNIMSNGLAELSLSKGELLDVFGVSEKSAQWLVVISRETGKRGMVPANYVTLKQQ